MINYETEKRATEILKPWGKWFLGRCQFQPYFACLFKSPYIWFINRARLTAHKAPSFFAHVMVTKRQAFGFTVTVVYIKLQLYNSLQAQALKLSGSYNGILCKAGCLGFLEKHKKHSNTQLPPFTAAPNAWAVPRGSVFRFQKVRAKAL